MSEITRVGNPEVREAPFTHKSKGGSNPPVLCMYTSTPLDAVLAATASSSSNWVMQVLLLSNSSTARPPLTASAAQQGKDTSQN